MKVVVAGASGFLGRPLVAALRQAGHEVRRLVRTDAVEPDAIPWRPADHALDSKALDGVDVVVNLAGENIGAGRWTPGRRERVMRSRVEATSTLVAAMAEAKPRPRVLVNASAVGFYGDRGDETLTERDDIGQGFLSEVCLAWETHAETAKKHGVRTALLRFGIILAPEGGALGKMLPFFRWGLGGRLGSGTQWMSWVARDDAIGVVETAIRDERYSGPINVTAPEPVTNAEFTAALGRVLHRPARFTAPAWALRLAFGRMADEMLLASTRAEPGRLSELGYSFQHPSIEGALETLR